MDRVFGGLFIAFVVGYSGYEWLRWLRGKQRRERTSGDLSGPYGGDCGDVGHCAVTNCDGGGADLDTGDCGGDFGGGDCGGDGGGGH